MAELQQLDEHLRTQV